MQKETETELSISIAPTKPEEINVIALDKLLTHVYKRLGKRESKHLVVAAQMYNAVRMLQS